ELALPDIREQEILVRHLARNRFPARLLVGGRGLPRRHLETRRNVVGVKVDHGRSRHRPFSLSMYPVSSAVRHSGSIPLALMAAKAVGPFRNAMNAAVAGEDWALVGMPRATPV